LAEQADALPRFTQINFPGYTLTARELHAALEAETGKRLALKQMSWWPLYLARPFWKLAKPLLEMRYLWQTPHSITSTRFSDVLPEFEPTPLPAAIAASLPDQVNPDRVMARATLNKRRPFDFCCGNAKVA